jgi:alpha-amylase/alpha-mannosidase (GH57 family)
MSLRAFSQNKIKWENHEKGNYSIQSKNKILKFEKAEKKSFLAD